MGSWAHAAVEAAWHPPPSDVLKPRFASSHFNFLGDFVTILNFESKDRNKRVHLVKLQPLTFLVWNVTPLLGDFGGRVGLLSFL